MSKLRALTMALPLLAMTAPAFAVDLSGDYSITITGGRSAYAVGDHGCITLTQTGDVLGFTNSGTAAARGKTGDYYALRSVITVAFPTRSCRVCCKATAFRMARSPCSRKWARAL